MSSDLRLPRIPMHPTKLPHPQKDLETTLPRRPIGFETVVGWEPWPEGTAPVRQRPRKAHYLGMVEWAWSPMHMRLDAMYLQGGSKDWVLWSRSWDDNESRWDWMLSGWGPKRAIDMRTASTHLLIDYWRFDGVGHFHWVAEEGELAVGDWMAIGREVWGDQVAAE